MHQSTQQRGSKDSMQRPCFACHRANLCLLVLAISSTICTGYSSASSRISCSSPYTCSSSTSPAGRCSLEGSALAGSVFPTDNEARSVTGRELHDLLSISSGRGNATGVAVLFYLAGDPPSVAMMPVFKCLAAFFPEEVQFVTVAYSELSLMALMSQGLHALPVLQVTAQGRRYRYSGKHWLRPMLHFVSRALGQEPVASLDVAHFCSRQNQLLAAGAAGGGGSRLLPAATCKQPSLADVCASCWPGGVAASRQTTSTQTMCRKVWECSRWDGEVTLEELKAQRPPPLLYISLAFLGLRAIWMLRKWRSSPAQAAQVIAAGAPLL